MFIQNRSHFLLYLLIAQSKKDLSQVKIAFNSVQKQNSLHKGAHISFSILILFKLRTMLIWNIWQKSKFLKLDDCSIFRHVGTAASNLCFRSMVFGIDKFHLKKDNWKIDIELGRWALYYCQRVSLYFNIPCRLNAKVFNAHSYVHSLSTALDC